jgi:hypothetical protein
VNRAIALYEFINAQLQAGNDLLVRDQVTERLSFSGSYDEELGVEDRRASPSWPGADLAERLDGPFRGR